MSRHVSAGEAVAFWVTMGFLITFTVAALVALIVVVYRRYWRPASRAVPDTRPGPRSRPPQQQ